MINLADRRLLVAWVKKYIFKIHSPSAYGAGYEFEYDMLKNKKTGLPDMNEHMQRGIEKAVRVKPATLDELFEMWDRGQERVEKEIEEEEAWDAYIESDEAGSMTFEEFLNRREK